MATVGGLLILASLRISLLVLTCLATAGPALAVSVCETMHDLNPELVTDVLRPLESFLRLAVDNGHLTPDDLSLLAKDDRPESLRLVGKESTHLHYERLMDQLQRRFRKKFSPEEIRLGVRRLITALNGSSLEVDEATRRIRRRQTIIRPATFTVPDLLTERAFALTADGKHIIANYRRYETATGTEVTRYLGEDQPFDNLAHVELAPDEGIVYLVNDRSGGTAAFETLSGERRPGLPGLLLTANPTTVLSPLGTQAMGVALSAGEKEGMRFHDLVKIDPESGAVLSRLSPGPKDGGARKAWPPWLPFPGMENKPEDYRLAYSADGRLLAAAGAGELHLWDVDTQTWQGILHGAWGKVVALAFDQSGNRLYGVVKTTAGTKYGGIREKNLAIKWDLTTGIPEIIKKRSLRSYMFDHPRDTHTITHQLFTPGARYLITLSRGNKANGMGYSPSVFSILSTQGGDFIASNESKNGYYKNLSLSADGSTLALSRTDRKIEIWYLDEF